ncbi:hypothetical protein [Streptomyces sp. Inha503]|uniref:hypothetical protein n=1 Tax=Streptomyces sp. Inha503 TaxID=3383314 RepID=UPI0039A13909
MAGAVATGLASTVSGVLAGFVVSRLGLSAIMNAPLAILPDQVPERQRGKVSGLLGFTAQIAGVIGFQLADPLGSSGPLLFLVPAVGRTWVGRFLVQLSLMFLTTYQLYFLTDHLGYELDEVTRLLALTGGVGLVMPCPSRSPRSSHRACRRSAVATTTRCSS